jgi:Transposase DDE domain
LMGLTISAPDHSTISRRTATLPAIQPASVPHGPLHVLIDSTGMQVYGADQWLEAKGCEPKLWDLSGDVL